MKDSETPQLVAKMFDSGDKIEKTFEALNQYFKQSAIQEREKALAVANSAETRIILYIILGGLLLFGSGIFIGTQVNNLVVWYEAIIDSVELPLIVADNNMNITLVNNATANGLNTNSISDTATVYAIQQGRVLGAASVDTGADIATLVTIGTAGLSSVSFAGFNAFKKGYLKRKIKERREFTFVGSPIRLKKPIFAHKIEEYMFVLI